MEVAGIALRDVIIVASGLTATYLVILLLRLVQLGRHKFAADEEPTMETEAAASPPDEVEVEDEAPAVYARPFVRAAAAVREPEPEPRPVLARAPEREAPPSFGSELARSQDDTDARQLRSEVGRLRTEMTDLRQELSRMQATRNVSPQYTDAMTMAQRGLTAQDVADRCGISLGEAELIWALSRGPMNFDQEEDYGGDTRPKHIRAA